MEVLLRLAMQAHVMGGPERGELLASGRELADEVGEVAVERISSDLRAQGRDAFFAARFQSAKNSLARGSR